MSKNAADPVKLSDQLQRRAAELLKDGAWHDRERVIREIGKLIAPGIAIRRNERDRSLNSRGRLGQAKPRHIPIEPEAAVRAGRRSIARDALGIAAYESKKDADGKTYIRMKHPPRITAGDARRAELLLPAFNDLAATFTRLNLPEAVWQVRAVAHENGLHVKACPKGCVIGKPPERPPELSDEPE